MGVWEWLTHKPSNLTHKFSIIPTTPPTTPPPPHPLDKLKFVVEDEKSAVATITHDEVTPTI